MNGKTTTLIIIHRFHCWIEDCASVHENHMPCLWSLSDRPPYPSMPDGWRMVGHLLICQKHHVEIDGKPLT